MKSAAGIVTLLLALTLGVAIADEGKVRVIALFANKALLQVGDKQKIVEKGETFEGVLLQSASGRGAVVVIDGKPVKLGINQSIAGNFKKAQRSSLRIYSDSLGMYYVEGEINGQSTRFLVDTGATFVTMSGAKARSLKINYRKGIPSTAQTASAIVPVWQIRLHSVSIGGIQVNNVDATVIAGDQPFEVLLGNSFLQHTRIQKAGSMLEIEKRF
ncbi:MAG: retroviral-like aspartic protease family protein [Gammaproteobacteria bacterium]|nr:retroviral-like aspartic protease family protein [Gammaproteobacteria bacterium]MDH3534946.1 retroviral-like aspartic protease family protein [Gammaproteobacteria bacterium]